MGSGTIHHDADRLKVHRLGAAISMAGEESVGKAAEETPRTSVEEYIPNDEIVNSSRLDTLHCLVISVAHVITAGC